MTQEELITLTGNFNKLRVENQNNLFTGKDIKDLLRSKLHITNYFYSQLVKSGCIIKKANSYIFTTEPIHYKVLANVQKCSIEAVREHNKKYAPKKNPMLEVAKLAFASLSLKELNSIGLTIINK